MSEHDNGHPSGLTKCPGCGSDRGPIRVEHTTRSSGATYDRYFCPRCCSSVEVHGPAHESPSAAKSAS
jgi:transposase-like protein